MFLVVILMVTHNIGGQMVIQHPKVKQYWWSDGDSTPQGKAILVFKW